METLCSDDVEKVVWRAAEIAAPLFRDNGWEYSSVDSIPDKDELADTLWDLVTRLEDDPEITRVSTGRWHVAREDDYLEISLDMGMITKYSVDP